MDALRALASTLRMADEELRKLARELARRVGGRARETSEPDRLE